MVQKSLIFFLIQIILAGHVCAQMTAQTATSIVDSLKKGNKNFDKAIVDYLKNEKNTISNELIYKVEKEIGNKHTPLYPEICFLMGKHFYQSDYQKSYYYFYKTLKTAPDLSDYSKEYLSDFHEKMGITYFYFQRYKESTHHLKKALQFESSPSDRKISCYNTLGLVYRNQNKLGFCRYYTRLAYDLAVKSNDKPWIGVLSGNLGFLILKQKKYDRARKLLTSDYNISKETKQHESQITALTSLIKIDIELNELDKIPPKIIELSALKDRTHLLSSKRAYYEAMKNYLEVIGDYKGALSNYKMANIYFDSIAKKRDALAIRNFEFQMDFELKQAEIKVLNEKHKKDELRLFALIVSLILFGLISILIIRRILKRRRKERELHLQKQNEIEKELKKSESELHAILDNLIKKNTVIDQLKNEIETINSEKDSSLQKEKLFESLQSFTLLTDEDWDTFKRLFEKLHPGFISFFKINFPDVTASEIRLATLIKLNLSNSEMANALGISPDSVRKTSLRLRKKLDINSNDELISFIFSLITDR
ncbi:MAG: helix-turn-helix transcriptional regulator [Bacteroidota bacterium]